MKSRRVSRRVFVASPFGLSLAGLAAGCSEKPQEQPLAAAAAGPTSTAHSVASSRVPPEGEAEGCCTVRFRNETGSEIIIISDFWTDPRGQRIARKLSWVAMPRQEIEVTLDGTPIRCREKCYYVWSNGTTHYYALNNRGSRGAAVYTIKDEHVAPPAPSSAGRGGGSTEYKCGRFNGSGVCEICMGVKNCGRCNGSGLVSPLFGKQ
jgi:hypothetical protein